MFWTGGLSQCNRSPGSARTPPPKSIAPGNTTRTAAVPAPMEGARRRRPAGRIALAQAAVAVSVSLLGCASSAPPPASVVEIMPAEAPLPTPGDRLLALLTDDNPEIERVSMWIVGIGDRDAIRAAGPRLVALARAVGSERWRRADLARMQEDEAPPAPPAGDRETQALLPILASMSHVGGPAVIEYCFALAADEAAPMDRRRLALRVLDRVLDPRDAARRVRRAELAARLPSPGPDPGPSPQRIAAYLQRSFRTCYARALRQDPAFSAHIRLTLRVGADGRVSSAIDGKLPADLARCIEDAVRGVRSLEPGQAAAAIVLPFTFTTTR
jgi:hypothetical protein